MTTHTVTSGGVPNNQQKIPTGIVAGPNTGGGIPMGILATPVIATPVTATAQPLGQANAYPAPNNALPAYPVTGTTAYPETGSTAYPSPVNTAPSVYGDKPPSYTDLGGQKSNV